MWIYVNISVLDVFKQTTWGVNFWIHVHTMSGAHTVSRVALMCLISFFPALLSRSLPSPAFILCALLFFWHGTDASSTEINLIHRVNLIFYMLINIAIKKCSKHMCLAWSGFQINFTWQVNRACIINSCPYILGLPSTVLILWVLTRFFYDDRGYVLLLFITAFNLKLLPCVKCYTYFDVSVLHWLTFGFTCSCWDDTDNVGIWWIIKGPITASLLVSIGVNHQVPD